MRSLAAAPAHPIHLAPRGQRLAVRACALALFLLGLAHVALLVVVAASEPAARLGLDDVRAASAGLLAAALGAIWLAGGAAFALAAYRLRAGLRWRPALAIGTLASLAVVMPVVLAAPGSVVAFALAADLAISAWLAYGWLSQPRPLW